VWQRLVAGSAFRVKWVGGRCWDGRDGV